MSDLGRLLIGLGLLLVLAGLVVILVGKTGLPLGRLPGDTPRSTSLWGPAL